MLFLSHLSPLLRCEIDERAEKIGYKIRAARLERVPYMLIVGEKEVENNSVSVRKRDDGDLGNMPISSGNIHSSKSSKSRTANYPAEARKYSIRSPLEDVDT